jgi:hypothetical protein
MLELIVLATLSLVGTDPTQDDWRWLDEHRNTAFEALMPVTGGESSLVVYRSYRDLYQDVPEAYFSIRQGPTLEALVVVPVGASVQQQLLNLRMADRSASFESVLTGVRVNRLKMKAPTCPAIQQQLKRLGKLRFSVPDLDLIILHPDVHRVVVDVGGGTVDAVLHQDEHPLVKWCLETLRALQQCAAAQ